MNKKIFATALFALAAFVSTGASAAITYGDSVGSGVQTDNALVNPGGTSRANDLTIVAGTATTDIPADSEIIIRLPAGLNFSGAPTYAVTAATPTQGLTLKDNTTFGDPTLGEDVGVELFDTDADGGMDRAVVVVSAAAAAGDTLTVSVSVVANADATVGTKKASIIVNGGLAQTRDIAEVTSDVITGVVTATGDELVTVDQMAYTNVDVSTPAFGIVLPAGTKNGDTVTLKPAGKVQWSAGTSTLTIAEVYTPLSVLPLTGTALVSGSPSAPIAGATTTVTLTVQGAPTDGFVNDVVIALQLNEAAITASSAIGNYGLTIAGTAGVSGTADLFAVKPNGSSAALTSTAKLTTLVAGSSAEQILPDFVITENFDGDAFVAAPSSTITLTAGTGLKFGNDTSTVTITDGGATTAVVTLTSSNTVMNIDLGTNNGPTLTITISGVKATATSSASGDLSMTVTGVLSSAPNSTFAVATAVPVGGVDVTGPTTLDKVGPDEVGNVASFVLSEETYGAITRSAFSTVTTTTGTQTIQAYFSVMPSSNADITAVTLTPVATYSVGTAPTFGACAVAGAGSDTWVCTVTAESTGLAAGTDTVGVQITYDADAMVGDTISMTFGGNAAVEGTADVATVVESTEAKVSGAITVVKEGLTTAQAVATLTITEKFAGGITQGQYRLIAPAGVVFATPYPDITGGVTATIAADTFAPNDTLVIHTTTTPSITINANVIVASTVSGYIPFDLVDGDIDAAFKTGITPDSIDLAYADKTLTALSAGADVAVNAGFSKSSNSVTGGLLGDGYSVTSSNTATVTASIANVGGTQTLTVHGVAAGSANVTVTDELGATDVVVVTVTAGPAIPAAEKATKGAGDRTGVSFSAGATSDGGSSYGTTFTVDDDVTIIATVDVDSTDQGSAGAIHAAIRANTAGGVTFSYLDEDGNFADWDVSGLPGANIVTDSLGASYTITIYSGQLTAGTYRIALAYTTEGGALIYTGKAIVITITE